MNAIKRIVKVLFSAELIKIIGELNTAIPAIIGMQDL